MISLPNKISQCIVTGGTGFIGSHICEELVKQGKKVICLDIVDRPENRRGWWNKDLCTLVITDVLTVSKYRRYFDKSQIVFHNACSKAVVCRKDPLRDLMVNARGSWYIFRSAMKTKIKVVHASTGSVNNGAPVSFYGVSKLAAEGYLRSFAAYYDKFKYTGIRYYHVYGPRQSDVGVVPTFINNILRVEPIVIHGDGEQKRYFTYVKDVVNANFLAAIDKDFDNKFVDYIGPKSYSINTLADIIEKKMGFKNYPRINEPIRKGDIFDFDAKNTILPNELITSFDEGMDTTIEWYKDNFSNIRTH